MATCRSRVDTALPRGWEKTAKILIMGPGAPLRIKFNYFAICRDIFPILRLLYVLLNFFKYEL